MSEYKTAAEVGGAPAAVVKDTPAASNEPMFTMGVSDRAGNPLSSGADEAPVPSDSRARQLVFDVHIMKGGPSPTTADMELYRELSRIEHALQELYPDEGGANESRFRQFFVRLFYTAQLALQGDVKTDASGKKVVAVGGRLSPEAAKAEIKALASDLIEDAAPHVKSRHLRELGRWAAALGAPLLLAYVLVSLLTPSGGGGNGFVALLEQLHIVPQVAANFCLLWVGTLIGVCLSYAFRTTEFTLADLTRTDSDHLAPYLRLVITGTLSMLLVLMALVGLGDVSIGSMSISGAAEKPMLAFVVGAILGIGEQKLSGTVAQRAGDLFGSGK